MSVEGMAGMLNDAIKKENEKTSSLTENENENSDSEQLNARCRE